MKNMLRKAIKIFDSKQWCLQDNYMYSVLSLCKQAYDVHMYRVRKNKFRNN